MKYHDTSHHEKRMSGGEITSDMKNAAVPNRSDQDFPKKGPSPVGKRYIPRTVDPDGRDDHSAHDSDETFESGQ